MAPGPGSREPEAENEILRYQKTRFGCILPERRKCERPRRLLSRVRPGLTLDRRTVHVEG